MPDSCSDSNDSSASVSSTGIIIDGRITPARICVAPLMDAFSPSLDLNNLNSCLNFKKNCEMSKKNIIIMNMCGRGDKDIFTVAKKLKINI